MLSLHLSRGGGRQLSAFMDIRNNQQHQNKPPTSRLSDVIYEFIILRIGDRDQSKHDRKSSTEGA
eukprot:scaffold13625_cov48-Attheya_sp.AAC.2